jgi:hypothetical protein
VTRTTRKSRDLNAAVIEMRKELARKIAMHAQLPGEKSYSYSGFGALPSHHAHGMLSRHVRAQPFRFRTRTKARQSRWDHLPLRRIVVSSVADRTGSRFTQLSLQVPMQFDLPSGKIFVRLGPLDVFSQRIGTLEIPETVAK